MKTSLMHIIRSKPIFLYLLPIFFVLHGFIENYDFVPPVDALLLTLLYVFAALVLAGVAWLFYRDFTKAALLSFLLMALQFFFGSLQDELKKLFPGTFITRYGFILPLFAVFFITIIILLKKRKRPLRRTIYYLNTLLLLVLLMDMIWLGNKALLQKKKHDLPEGFSACITCQKPDIYFILADEYAGNRELKEVFHFDDSAFLTRLTARGFHVVPDSYSNYNYTPFSLASILNMEYLNLSGRERSKTDLTFCYQMIKNNRFLRFLQASGYRFYNYSVFDFEGQPARNDETFLPNKTKLITAQTFISRLFRDIGFNLVTKLHSKKEIRAGVYNDRTNNDDIYGLTWQLAGNGASPKLVYTHLMMPHYPYYFDKDGKEQPFASLSEGNQVNKEHYIEYLQYANTKLLALVDHILQTSPAPPIIVLMGDHGFRHFIEPVAAPYYFLNLESVFLPSKNYSAFKDSLTAVNFLRALLNSTFRQNLPYLKDSTTYLRD